MSSEIEELHAKIRELEAEVQHLREEKDGSDDSTSDRIRETGDAIFDVATNFIRSSVDAQLEFVRSASQVLGNASERAQDEMQRRDDESQSSSLARLPSAIIKAVADSVNDSTDVADNTVGRFNESFKTNRADYKKERQKS